METGDTGEASQRQSLKKRAKGSSSEKTLKDVKRLPKEGLLKVIETLQKHIVKLKSEQIEALKEKEELQRVNEKYDGKLARLKDEIYNLQDQIEDRDNEIEDLQSKIKKLKKKTKQDDAASENDCKCEHECDRELQDGDCKEKMLKADENREENEFQEVFDDMGEECAMQQDMIEKLENEVKDCENTIEDMKSEIEDRENTIEDLESKIENRENTIEDLDSKIEERENAIEVMESKIEDLERQLSVLKERIESQENTIDEKEFQIENLTKENEFLRSRLSDLEQDYEIPVDDIDGVSPRSANSTLRILKPQYLRLQNEHNDITQKYAQLQEENSELKMKVQIPSTTDAGIQCDQEMELSPSEDEPEKCLESPRSVVEIDMLREELDQSRREVKELTTLKNEMIQERASMIEYMHLARNSSTELEKQNNELAQILDVTTEEKMDLRKKVDALQIQLHDFQVREDIIPPKKTCSVGDRVNTKVIDLVKFHESKTLVDEKSEPPNTKRALSPFRQQWPVKAASGRLNVEAHESCHAVKSSPELNTQVPKKEPMKSNTKNIIICDGNIGDIAQALTAVKSSADKLKVAKKNLELELQSTRQKHEWQLNLSRLQLERTECLYRALQDDKQKMAFELQTGNGRALQLSQYYQELVNEMEFEMDQLQEENAILRNELEDLQEHGNRELERLSNEIKSVYKEKNNLEEEYREKLQEIQDNNAKLVKQIKDIGKSVKKQKEDADAEDKIPTAGTVSADEVKYYSPIPARFRDESLV